MNILDKEREDVAFDILYSGDSSVIHRPLRERQHLLQKAIRPLKGRLELLLPESGGLNAHRPSGKQSFLSCFIFFDVTWFRN
jgi:DNA ligase-4